jgi:hypothetical protein
MSFTKFGVSDLLIMTSNFHPKWYLFAVESTLEKVKSEFTKLLNIKHEEVNIPIMESTIEGDLLEGDALDNREFAYVIPVIKPLDSKWIVIYSELFYSNKCKDYASVISEILQSRAISLYREDTSNVLGYSIFDKGQERETAEGEYGSYEDFYWKSSLQGKPELKFIEYEEDDESSFNESVWENFVNETFRSFELYLPALYPIQEGGSTVVEMQVCSDGMVERVDLLYP